MATIIVPMRGNGTEPAPFGGQALQTEVINSRVEDRDVDDQAAASIANRMSVLAEGLDDTKEVFTKLWFGEETDLNTLRAACTAVSSRAEGFDALALLALTDWVDTKNKEAGK